MAIKTTVTLPLRDYDKLQDELIKLRKQKKAWEQQEGRVTIDDYTAYGFNNIEVISKSAAIRSLSKVNKLNNTKYISSLERMETKLGKWKVAYWATVIAGFVGLLLNHIFA